MLTGQHTKKVGRATVFYVEEENSFVRHIISLSDLSIPFSMWDLGCIVKSYVDSRNRKVSHFKENMPGRDWGQSFLQRYRATSAQKFETNISRDELK